MAVARLRSGGDCIRQSRGIQHAPQTSSEQILFCDMPIHQVDSHILLQANINNVHLNLAMHGSSSGEGQLLESQAANTGQ